MIVIPARFGSTRFKGKMLYPINGIPALAWTLRGCLDSGEKVVVATDDMNIAHVAMAEGATAIMTGYAPTGTHRVYDAVKDICDDDEKIINVQGDCLMMTGDLIKKFLKKATVDAEIWTMMYRTNSLGVEVVLEDDGFAADFLRTTDRAKCWRHIGVYQYKLSTLAELVTLEPNKDLEQMAWLDHGYSIYPVDMGAMKWRHLDVSADIKQLERMLA